MFSGICMDCGFVVCCWLFSVLGYFDDFVILVCVFSFSELVVLVFGFVFIVSFEFGCVSGCLWTCGL